MSVQDKLELEQVPLKSDVDTTPMIDVTPAEVEAATETTKKKAPCQWFFKKRNGEIIGNGYESGGEEKKMHCKWWSRKEKCMMNGESTENDTKDTGMTVGMNMLDRDENDMNKHIVMDFGDVFAEPDACHSWNWTWLSASRVYRFTSNTVYKLLAAIVAIPLAMIFGVIFGLFSVIGIFISTPIGRMLAVPCMTFAKAWNFIVRCLLDPIFASIGLMCLKTQNTNATKKSNDLV